MSPEFTILLISNTISITLTILLLFRITKIHKYKIKG